MLWAYLDAVLEAVKLEERKTLAWMPKKQQQITQMPMAEQLTSQQELAIWQPAWPTREGNTY